MSIEDSNLKLFRISISKLNKIKEKKNSNNHESHTENIKCLICWESSNLDLINLKCLSCNHQIIIDKKIIRAKKSFNFFNITSNTDDSQTTHNKIQTKSEKNKIYFNNNYYSKNLSKEDTVKTCDQDNLRTENCDANCKCLLM
jgi:hypothetical protein